MAGSRFHKIGNIFSRTSGLLKSGAISEVDKPIWYDLYEAFPPKVEPSYGRPEPVTQIRQILYPEDIIRAKFYKKYGSVGIINLSESNQRKVTCQLFVEEYIKKEKEGDLSEEELMEEAAMSLERIGIYLNKDTPETDRKSKGQAVSSDSVNFKLSKLFKESRELENK